MRGDRPGAEQMSEQRIARTMR